MSILNKTKNRKSRRGQGLVEFALAFPIFLLIVLGIFEFGRLFVIYTSVYAAAREGARYGAAVDNLCNSSIEAEAERVGFLAGDLNVTTSYQVFDEELKLTGNECANVKAGDRVIVQVSIPFNFITGFIPVPGGGPITLTSTAQRTIIKGVYVGVTVPPPATSEAHTTPNNTPTTNPTHEPTPTDTPVGFTPSPTATPIVSGACVGEYTASIDDPLADVITVTLSNDTGETLDLDELLIFWANNGKKINQITYTDPSGESKILWIGLASKSPFVLSFSPTLDIPIGTSTFVITFDKTEANVEDVQMNFSAGEDSRCSIHAVTP